MNTVSKEVLKNTELELASFVKRFVVNIEDGAAVQIAKEIINLIDWDNSALMHKGLSWMTKNYLMQKNMI